MNIQDSNVHSVDFQGRSPTTGSSAFRLINTAGRTTRLVAHGGKMTSLAGAITNRYVRNDGTGCSYYLDGIDMSESEGTQIVFDSSVPAEGVIKNTIPPVEMQRTSASLDTTPSIRGVSILIINNAGATVISALDDGFEGQTVELHFTDAVTTVDFTGTTLKGNAGVDWTPAAGDIMRCTKRGANWYCSIVDCTA